MFFQGSGAAGTTDAWYQDSRMMTPNDLTGDHATTQIVTFPLITGRSDLVIRTYTSNTLTDIDTGLVDWTVKTLSLSIQASDAIVVDAAVTHDGTGGLVLNQDVTITGGITYPMANVAHNWALDWNGGFQILRLSEAAKRQHRRAKIREQWQPTHAIRNHRNGPARANNVSFADAPENEVVALRLLRGLVDDREFRRYLKYGFIRVQGASGLTYQIQRSNHIIEVWRGHQEIARLCLYLSSQFPPTDGVVAMMLMVEHDEMEIWQKANVHCFGEGLALKQELLAA